MSDINNLSPVTRKKLGVIEFLKLVLMRWYLFVTIVVVCAVTAFVYSVGFITPLYESTAKLYIVNKDSGEVEAADLSISTVLVEDFATMIADEIVLDDVSDDLNGKYTTSQLKSYISVTNPENTRIIKLSVRSPKPEDSKRIVDSVCRVSQEKLIDVMGLDRIKIVGEGNVPNSPCSPNVTRNVAVAIIFGLAISGVLVCIFYLMDNTISDEKDIEKYLGITALGAIPYNPKAKASKIKKNKS